MEALPSQINLFTTLYQEKKESRYEELITCLEKNLENPCINRIVIFNEKADLSGYKSEKLVIIPISSRPIYQDFFDLINDFTLETDINIIANSDIYFDNHIGVLQYLHLSDKCITLTRWDTDGYNKPVLYNRSDSQDVWIFKGKIKSGIKADFPLGVPRCDNRLLYELQEVGYRVINPAFSIKAYHFHKARRNEEYTEADNVYKIPPPYRYKYPHNLFGLWKTLIFNLKHPYKLSIYQYDIKKINFWWPVRLLRKTMEIIVKRKLPLIGYG